MIDLDRFRGAFIGQCLGDALGFPVEGQPPEVCARYVQQVLRAGRAGEVSAGSFPFGQYTDDSQLARELLSSLFDHAGLDPADFARRIVALFRDHRVVGGGRATEAAAKRLAQGVPWYASGTPPPSAGNGSAMRAGPIGMAFYNDSAAMVTAAVDQGRITHRDVRCSAGAVAIAGAVALALKSEAPPVARDFAAQLAAWARPIAPSVADALLQLPRWVALAPEEAVVEISVAGKEPGTPDDGWRGISPFVTPSVLWSLYAFLRSPDDYWETVCTAIAVGGDVDTTAAMAGAVSGARVGFLALPRALVERLEDRGTWRLPELLSLVFDAHARFAC